MHFFQTITPGYIVSEKYDTEIVFSFGSPIGRCMLPWKKRFCKSKFHLKKGIWEGRISDLIFSILSGLFRCFVISVCIAKRQKEVGNYGIFIRVHLLPLRNYSCGKKPTDYGSTEPAPYYYNAKVFLLSGICISLCMYQGQKNKKPEGFLFIRCHGS